MAAEEKISVSVRVRPQNKREAGSNEVRFCQVAWRQQASRSYVFTSTGVAGGGEHVKIG